MNLLPIGTAHGATSERCLVEILRSEELPYAPIGSWLLTSGRGSGVVGYNVQVAVDTKHHLIVTHEVTNVILWGLEQFPRLVAEPAGERSTEFAGGTSIRPDASRSHTNTTPVLREPGWCEAVSLVSRR
jgi:hypothetical protein